jgi:hypothetical protein
VSKSKPIEGLPTLAPQEADWRDPLKRRGDGFLGDERTLLMAFQLAPLAGMRARESLDGAR